MTFRIEHRIGVAAPAAEVWAVISDLERWGEWNPIYPKASGRVAIGSPIDFRLELPGRKPMEYRGIVGDWVPGEQLIWHAKLMGGLIKTTRYIEIDTLSETGCILANGELYEGIGADFLPQSIRRLVQGAFRTMNERAKARVEGARASGAGVAEASGSAETAAA